MEVLEHEFSRIDYESTKKNRDFPKKIPIQYPEPGSNRHGLPHWCLRPARLPIPPSGLKAGAKLYFLLIKAKFFS